MEEQDGQNPIQKETVLARDAMLDSIAKQVADERQSEQDEPEDMEPEENNEGVDNESEEDDEPEELVELKVDGEVVQKTQAEIDELGGQAEVQKSLTADRRLQQAAQERQQLAQQRDELNRQRAQFQQLQNRQKESEYNTDEAYKEYAEAVYSGDEDQLIAAMKKLPNNQHQQMPDVRAEVQRELAAANRQQSIDVGKRNFAEQYSDIANDPTLYGIANQNTVAIMRDRPELSPQEVIMEAGRMTQEWRDSLFEEPKQSEELAERTQAKRNKVKLPTAKARNQSNTGYKAKTQDEIFAEMKANRSR